MTVEHSAAEPELPEPNPPRIDYLARTSRRMQRATGLAALLLGVPLLALAGFAAYRFTLGLPPTSLPTLLAIWSLALALGLLLTAAGARLLSGRARRDGGLLGAPVLALGGLLFLATPFVLSARNGEPVVDGAWSLVAGLAALGLAWRRWRHPPGH